MISFKTCVYFKQHVVFFLKIFMDFVIPDRSTELEAKIKREYYIVQNMLLQAEKDQILSKYGAGDDDKLNSS